jgi:hypothetical protein
MRSPLSWSLYFVLLHPLFRLARHLQVCLQPAIHRNQRINYKHPILFMRTVKLQHGRRLAGAAATAASFNEGNRQRLASASAGEVAKERVRI